MKFTSVFMALFAAVASLPAATPDAYPDADAEAVAVAEFSKLETRQRGSTLNELVSGPCRAVTFIFARASTESGNVGSTVGPATCDGLKSRLGAANVACQGVGRPYTAALGDNVLPGGTSRAAIGEGVRLFNLAASRCPNTIITGGGYSQGAAVIHGVARDLTPAVRARVAGLITYGDTRNQQDRGRIPPFPAEQTRIFCNSGDRVCSGSLSVGPAHFAYSRSVPLAVSFLVSRVQAV